MNQYLSNTEKYKKELAALDKGLSGLSAQRVGVFVLPFIVVVLLANAGLIVPTVIIMLIWFFAFGSVMKHYNKAVFNQKHAALLKQVNEEELLRQKNELSHFLTGQEYIDANHPYAADFDVFAQHSLFQLINRTTTRNGRTMFSD